MNQSIKLDSTSNSADVPGFFDIENWGHVRPTGQGDQSDLTDLSVSDAAKLLGIAERTVWRRIRQKKLQSRQEKGRTIVSVRQSDVAVTHPDTDTDVSVESSLSVSDMPDRKLPEQLLGLIAELSSKLEGATYRNGFLEAQLEAATQQVKLLPDLQARAAEAEQLKLENLRLQSELELRKRTWWMRFTAWALGKTTELP
jgi:hypothetical protein